jgi:hypothetical protein
MIWTVILGVGLILGVVVGRWWALLAAVAFGVWIWRNTGVEISHEFLGFVSGGFAAIGIAAGVFVRRRLKRPS